jgi:ubiquinone/menaquinone biosynthesis C-methylase UbiE
MSIHQVSCYDNLSQYHYNEEQHIGYLQMINELITYLKKISTDKKVSILEFGAGTGLLTKHLMEIRNIDLEVSEPDERCISLLSNVLNINKITKNKLEEIKPDKEFDCVISSFAHDHINTCHLAAKCLSKIIKNDGYYLAGLELLRPYENKEEYKNALKAWHNFVIKDAESNGNEALASLEKEALHSGLKEIADFKVSKVIFEKSMQDNGFEIEHSNKVTKNIPENIGGVYFYVWRKKA